MAINASTVWEFQTGGSDNNGGGYITSGGGTDYSQSTSSILSVVDGTQTGASNTLGLVTGAFTSAMSGNTLFIRAGSNFTVGFYQIVNFVNSTTVVIDRTAAATVTAASGIFEVGGCRNLLSANTFGTTAIVAGNTIYIGSGSYVMNGNFLSTAGGATASVTFIGYNAVRGDAPTGAARPLLNFGANSFGFNAKMAASYLQFTGTHLSGCSAAGENNFFQCKFISTATSGLNCAAKADGGAAINGVQYIGCEFTAQSASGIINTTGPLTLSGCYVHDCITGVSCSTIASVNFMNTIFSACSNAILTTDGNQVITAQNCTFYGAESPSGKGLSLNLCDDTVVLDSIFYGLTTAMFASSFRKSKFFAYNDFFNNTTNVVNINPGINDLAVDPQFSNAAGGNFSIGTNLKAAAFPGVFPGLATTTSYADIGAVQRSEGLLGGGNGFISGIIGS